MIIGIFGENCTGKSSIAKKIAPQFNAQIYTGKDYLKLSKIEFDAKKQFTQLLKENQLTDNNIIYVISEKEHLAFLPDRAIRILVTADLNVIKERFSLRLNNNLPTPIALMLEKKHGLFNNEKYDKSFDTTNAKIDDICQAVISLINSKHNSLA